MEIGNIFPRLLGPLYYRRYEHAPRVFRQFREYCRHDSLSADELQAMQIAKLRKLLIHACRNTEHYRLLFRQAAFNPETIKSIDDLSVLPLLSQDEVRSDRLNLYAGNIGSADFHTSTTGGTRGKKMPFHRDNCCRAQRLALQWRSDLWAGWRPYEKVAYLWPAIQDLEPPAGWKHTIKDHLIKRTHLFYGGMISEESARTIYEDLRAFRPAIIRCFTSPAYRLAEFMSDTGLKLPGLKAIVCTGEPLTVHQRECIQRGIGAPVFDLYASRELGTTAAECKAHRGMHIATDSVVLEVVRDGKTVPFGEPGSIVLTDLLNYAMPLIRYEIGDVGRVSRRSCSCGLNYPLLRTVVGRTVDGFYDREGTFISTIALGTLMDDGPPVGQLQLVQEDLGAILVRIGSTPHVGEDHRQYYTHALKQLMAGLTEVRFEIVDQIKTEKSGKYRFTISKLTRPLSNSPAH
jgi:phenylacetate-CoA ligase